MNIFQEISKAIGEINAECDVFMLDSKRAETENLNYTRAVCEINPKYKTTPLATQNLSVINTSVFDIRFLDLDEWSNLDYKDGLIGSYGIARRMEILCNSVFTKLRRNLNTPAENPISWTIESLIRETNGTMSGVKAQLTIPFYENLVCNYAV